jgi:hypothetical protein
MAVGISRSNTDTLTDDDFITPFFTDRPDGTPVKKCLQDISNTVKEQPWRSSSKVKFKQ